MAVTITWVKARQIFDSRGNPTVEVRRVRFVFPQSSMGRAVNSEICADSPRRCADVLRFLFSCDMMNLD
jgi:hypothetical protein